MNPTSRLRHGRALWKASVFAPMLLVVAMLAPAAALAADGSGTMTVNPTTVVASSTGNSLAFTYTAAEAVSSAGSGIVRVTVPAGWTAPATGNTGVAAGSPACTGLSRTVAARVITVRGTCATGAKLVITFSAVTAPAAAGPATFTTESRIGGGGSNYAAIASSPVVTVISHPTVTSTTPSSRGQGALSQNITITGTGFVTGATAAFSGTGITVNSTSFTSATSLTANITIAAGATIGARNVTVTNPDTGSGTGTGVFTVNLGPTVTSASPNMGVQGATALSVDIIGTDFSTGAWAPGDVTFSGTGITVSSVARNSATSLTAVIDIAAGATADARNVTVRNPADSGRGTGTSVFTVIVGTATSAAAANATAGDPSVVLTATVSPSSGSVDAGTVTFTIKSGATTIGTVTSGTVASNVATADFPLTSVSAGTYTIEAAYSGAPGIVASDNSLQPPPDLTIVPGPLDHLVLAPASMTVDPGVSQVYAAEGFDAFNNSRGDVTSATTFAISGGGSCTGASCSSMLAGSHTITGTDGTATGTATLTVAGVLGVVSSSTYHTLTPTRILDSRNGTGGITGAIAEHTAKSFQVTGVGGVPANASAVTGNLTVTGQTSNGYLFLGPVATNNPTSSTLNFPVADDRANAVTVGLDVTGKLWVTFVAPTAGQTTQVVFDVTGYFTPDNTGATYHAISPARLLDSRNGTGGITGAIGEHTAMSFQVTGVGGVPANASAVTGNLTVTGQTSNGYLFLGPVATNNPTSSTLNFPVADDRANAVTVGVDGAGKLWVTFVAPIAARTANVVFDVTGYFTPDMTGAAFVPLTPTRILDSRNGTGGITGPIAEHTAMSFQVTGAGSVPANASAVTGNLTVTGQSSNGYLFLGPVGVNNPTSSTLNFPVADDRANAVTVGVDGAGKLWVTFVAPTAAKTAYVVFDVGGYFVPASA